MLNGCVNGYGEQEMTELKKELFYAGLEPEEYAAVVPDARKENRKLLPIYAAAGAVLFSFLFLISMIPGGWFSENRWVYLGMVFIEFGFYVCARILSDKHPDIIDPLAMVFIATLYVFSFYISLSHPDLPAVTPVALLPLIPYFFNIRPIYEILLAFCACVFYCLLSFQMKSGYLAVSDLWNMGSFTIVTFIVTVVQARMKYQLMYQSRKNRYLGETDILTGVRNRNAYERNLFYYGKNCARNAACVYVDVNGLHEMNNTHGHAAGDQMIRTVANAMKKRFGDKNIYRIGGDEFVALQMDVSPEQLEQDVKAVREEINASGYAASFGTSVHDREGIDMKSLLEKAETEMYNDKRRYYSEKSHDRRRRN